jgi:hypothetical protein
MSTLREATAEVERLHTSDRGGLTAKPVYDARADDWLIDVRDGRAASQNERRRATGVGPASWTRHTVLETRKLFP